MKSNQLDTFKSHLIRLIKEELEGGEDEKQAGLEKALYDTVLAPSDIDAAVSALQNSKNYGIYAKNLTDRNEYNSIFGPNIPAQKANAAWKDWDSMFPKPGASEDQIDSLLNKRLWKIKQIKNNNPEDWEKLKDILSDKFKDYSIETGDDSFDEFVASLPSTELRFEKGIPFFGKSAGNYFLFKNQENTNKYTGTFKDDQYIVSGDKIIFPSKKNPFETKDYLEKVLKTIMGNAKIQYTLSQQESGDQPKTTSNTQGKVEKINFVKTFDSPELAAKFKRLIPKDFAEKTTVEGGKITVADITDPQKKNLMATALKFVADNAPKKKSVKEGISLDVKDGTKIQNVNNNETYTVDRKGNNTVYARNSKGKLITIDSKFFDAYKIIENMKESVKDFFKDPMNAADARGWMKNPKLSDTEKKDKIKSVMKDPSKFNDLMDEFTNELKPLQKSMKESVKDQIRKAIEEVLKEKKLTKAEINKKEDIVKAMKGTTNLPEPAMYAIATAKAKKLAEGINYDNLTKDSIEDLKSLIDIKKKEFKKLKSGTNIPPAVQGQIKKLGAEIGKIERELNSRKALEEEVEKPSILLPSNILTKVNSAVVDAKTFAEFIKDIYDQTQQGETIDFSKNQNLYKVLDYLNKAIGEKPGATQSTTTAAKPTTTAPNTPPSLK